MAQQISSFDDYVIVMTKKLRTLRHFKRCLFSAWCAQHLLTAKTSLVKQALSESEFRTLEDTLNALWHCLLAGSVPNNNVLNAIDNRFMEINPENVVAAIEVHPVVSTIGVCILGCRRRDVELTRQVAEEIINVLDYDMHEKSPDYAARSRETMFTCSEMNEELQIQLKMIKHLQGDYELDDRIRKLFRT